MNRSDHWQNLAWIGGSETRNAMGEVPAHARFHSNAGLSVPSFAKLPGWILWSGKTRIRVMLLKMEELPTASRY